MSSSQDAKYVQLAHKLMTIDNQVVSVMNPGQHPRASKKKADIRDTTVTFWFYEPAAHTQIKAVNNSQGCEELCEAMSRGAAENASRGRSDSTIIALPRHKGTQTVLQLDQFIPAVDVVHACRHITDMPLVSNSRALKPGNTIIFLKNIGGVTIDTVRNCYIDPDLWVFKEPLNQPLNPSDEGVVHELLVQTIRWFDLHQNAPSCYFRDCKEHLRRVSKETHATHEAFFSTNQAKVQKAAKIKAAKILERERKQPETSDSDGTDDEEQKRVCDTLFGQTRAPSTEAVAKRRRTEAGL